MIKKLLSILLSVMLVVTMAPTMAWAEPEVHSHEGWTEWTTPNSLPDEEGNYYLGCDVTLRSTWVVQNGTTNLDLNGYTLDLDGNCINIGDNSHTATLTINDSSDAKTGTITGGDGYQGGAISINKGGDLVMNGGTITDSGSNAYYGGAVYISDGRSFTMNGGTIGDNTAKGYGGGVYVSSDAAFTMNGGTIENNATTNDSYYSFGGGVYSKGTFNFNGGTITGNSAVINGGGVYIDSGSFNVSGDVSVTNNKKGTADNNVFLNTGRVINVTGDLSEDAALGITTSAKPTYDDPVTLTSGYTGDDPATVFSSDNSLYSVGKNTDGQAQLLIKSYDLWVDGNLVTDTNKNNIEGQRRASFDPETNTLHLKTGSSSTISGTESEGMIRYVGKETLNIQIDNNMTVKNSDSAGAAIYSETANVNITGSGVLTLDTNAKPVVLGGENILTLQDRYRVFNNSYELLTDEVSLNNTDLRGFPSDVKIGKKVTISYSYDSDNMTMISGSQSYTFISGYYFPQARFKAKDGYGFASNASATWTGSGEEIRMGRDSTKVNEFYISGKATTDLTITIPGVLPKNATPNAKFEATGDRTGKLTNLDPDADYTYSGWGSGSISKVAEYAISREFTSNNVTIKLIQKGDDVTSVDSDTQSITVKYQDKPSGVYVKDCTNDANDNGQIIGMTSGMEYQKKGDTSWTAATGETVSNLTDGTYYVRKKFSGSRLTSDNLTLTIRKHDYKFGLYLGGVAVTPTNANDITAAINAAGGRAEGTATYDSSNYTLNLENFHYTGPGYEFTHLSRNTHAALYSSDVVYNNANGIVLNVTGENSIVQLSDSDQIEEYCYGILSEGSQLSINGSGSILFKADSRETAYSENAYKQMVAGGHLNSKIYVNGPSVRFEGGGHDPKLFEDPNWSYAIVNSSDLNSYSATVRNGGKLELVGASGLTGNTGNKLYTKKIYYYTNPSNLPYSVTGSKKTDGSSPESITGGTINSEAWHYAKISPAEVHLIRQGTDGTWSEDEETLATVNSIPYAAPAFDHFTAVGYSMGAYKEPNADYSNLTAIPEGGIEPGSEGDLYVYYTREKYELVVYTDSTGTTKDEERSTDIYYGGKLPEALNVSYDDENAPSKEGHSFEGWALAADVPADGKTAYNYKEVDGGKGDEGETIISKKLDLSEYTVTGSVNIRPMFVLNRITVHLDTGAKDLNADETNLHGWTGNGNDTTPGVEMDVAQYRSFNTDIGEKIAMNGELNQADVKNGMNQATREGYTLFGWASANGTVWDPEWGTGLAYVDNNTLTHGQASYASYIMTLTAKWSPQGDTKAYEENTGIESYTITFDTNGGSAVAPISGTGSEPVTLAANPTKEGYSFYGWSTDKNAEVRITVGADENTIPAPKGDLTLHALWSANSYSIALDPNGGALPDGTVSPITVIPGSLVTGLPIPEKENAVFGGWQEGQNVISLPFTMGAENRNLTAKWLTKPGKPATPTVNEEDITGNSFTISAPLDGDGKDYQYSIDGGETWQESPAFTGLEPVKEYSVIDRLKGDGETTADSEPSDAKTVKTKKQDQAAPTAPAAEATGAHSAEVMSPGQAMEYAILKAVEELTNDTIWKSVDGNGKVIFNDLEESTDYNIYARMKATDYQNESPASQAAAVTTDTPLEEVAITMNGEPLGETAPKVGDTLTADAGEADPVSYQWYRGDEPIEGATDAEYTVSPDDIGQPLKVEALQRDASCESEPTAEVRDNESGGGGGVVTGYTITVNETENGTVTVDMKTAVKGTTVTVTVKSDEGYELDNVIVTDKNDQLVELTDKGDGTYTFKMPASNVEVTAAFREEKSSHHVYDKCGKDEHCPIYPFKDSDPKEWYHDGVHWALDEGVMNGTSKTAFEPGTPTTRAMIVTMLWRMEGEPEAEAAGFADVEAGSWYEAAVNWAAANEIVKGYSAEKFGPNDPVTREQLATILFRYSGEEDGGAAMGLAGYDDADQVSEWAKSAMVWAVSKGIINGVTKTTLEPQSSATRAQVATMLMRYSVNE